MSDLVLDASLALQWFPEDEADRQYGLSVLTSLSTKRAVVPILWFYEVGNGLLMACRRRRITVDQIDGFLIDAAQQTPIEVLDLPAIAHRHTLTNYDAAYLALALRLNLPLATTDADLRRAATTAGVAMVPE